MTMDYLKTLQEFFVDGEIEGQVLIQTLRLLESPLSQRAIISLHNYIVGATVDAIIIEIRDTGLQSEFFEASDLSKDVMKYAPVVDSLWKEELFDCNLGWLSEICFALKYFCVGTFCKFLPFFALVIEIDIEK